MAMGTRILIIMFVIDACLFIGTDLNRQFMEKFLNKFGMTLNTTTNEITYSTNIVNTLLNGWLTSLMSAGVGAIIGLMVAGATGLVAGGIVMAIFGDFVFAPISTMISIGMPWQITLIVGGVWVILFVIAMLDWVRGGEY